MQLNIFEFTKPKYKITKPIRLIELFAGIGSQAKALKNIGANFTHYKAIDFDKYAIASYNAIHNTNYYTSDITKIASEYLDIKDTDKYDYIMTYSFPCQDLSLAGDGKGMKKGDNTRSGLLWEVERLLDGMQELPQVLLMENVPQVIGSKNLPDFLKWERKLESLGYSNYFKNLNAKDYTIPQTRNRTYMISILGDYYYEFPRKKKLKLRLKDMLEEVVDEKYYLSDKMIASTLKEDTGKYNRKEVFLRNFNPKKTKASTITAKANNRPTDNFILEDTICLNSKVNGKQPSLQDRVYDTKGIATAITTSFLPSYVVKDTRPDTLGVVVPEATKKGYSIAKDGDGVYLDRPHQKRGVVQKGKIQTIKTSPNDVGVVVEDTRNLKEKLADDLIESGTVKGGETINHSYTNSKRNPNSRLELEDFVETRDGVVPTLTTRPDTLGVVQQVGSLRIRKLTPKETWRLMGFTDEDFEKAQKVNSDTQLYKQAGNSIVVKVLEAIFKELI